MSQIARNQDATQGLLAAALVIARSPTIRAWLRANDPMALQQLDTAVAAHQNADPPRSRCIWSSIVTVELARNRLFA